MHRKVSSLASSHQTPPSSSCHSLPLVNSPASEGIHQHPDIEPVELMTEAAVPPTTPRSSISEIPDELKGSSVASDADQFEPSDFRSVDTDAQPPTGHLSSIVEGDELRPVS